MVGRLPAIFMLQNVCSFRLFFITRLTPGYFAEDPAAALASCISIPGCSSTISFITSRIVLPSYTLFFPASKASSNAFRLIKSLPILLLLSPAPQGRNYNRVHGYKIRLVIYYRRCHFLRNGLFILLPMRRQLRPFKGRPSEDFPRTPRLPVVPFRQGLQHFQLFIIRQLQCMKLLRILSSPFRLFHISSSPIR